MVCHFSNRIPHPLLRLTIFEWVVFQASISIRAVYDIALRTLLGFTKLLICLMVRSISYPHFLLVASFIAGPSPFHPHSFEQRGGELEEVLLETPLFHGKKNNGSSDFRFAIEFTQFTQVRNGIRWPGA